MPPCLVSALRLPGGWMLWKLHACFASLLAHLAVIHQDLVIAFSHHGGELFPVRLPQWFVRGVALWR